MAAARRGRLAAVVGPSGAGKDTLMAEAKRLRPDLVWAQRVVTRPEEAGGEPYESVDAREFHRRREAGAFAVWWEAHDLLYGVPATIEADLEAGRTVMFNGSRAAIGQARLKFPGLSVIVVTAPDEVLARRLAARGRESEAEIRERLQRAAYPAPAGATVVVNDGAVSEGAGRLLAALNPDLAIDPFRPAESAG
ncbi:MAG: phosphonate metabolism protein/1,5-bisphosphokinase (PRPP-forming) PhnN [Pseudomonadota bacterium]